ncbi:hypothetical protein SAMN02745220_03165 [Desulfopila aestuarii DSM 18488]|uniref:Uncharacterized protein n=1 Tax=Desulfopila aestuarii DSM 18488 TaxID=1121416 RepID=A0A1M7YBC2_9BACT|nr:hypothetical protein SAMN02745220_03165 [Desulfopila aestuarii DSM 18488]
MEEIWKCVEIWSGRVCHIQIFPHDQTAPAIFSKNAWMRYDHSEKRKTETMITVHHEKQG